MKKNQEGIKNSKGKMVKTTENSIHHRSAETASPVERERAIGKQNGLPTHGEMKKRWRSFWTEMVVQLV